MRHLRKPTKLDTLVNLFDKIGDSMKVEQVCEITGIKNYDSLKALCTYIRKAKHIPDENRMDIHIQDGYCIRVN